MSVVTNAGPKLIPFFKSLTLYYAIFIPHDQPGYLAALLKCLPIVSLMIFVVWFAKHNQMKDPKFPRRLLTGLIFCCLGDYCLIWPALFELGMLSFAIGHINYIMAFGFQPLHPRLGFINHGLTLGAVLYLLPDLKGVLLPGVPIYTAVLNTMVWRTSVRLKEGPWTWTKLFTYLGALSFAISDLVIGLDKFKFKVPYDQAIIMTTYYLAQFGLALSIIDNVDKKIKK